MKKIFCLLVVVTSIMFASCESPINDCWCLVGTSEFSGTPIHINNHWGDCEDMEQSDIPNKYEDLFFGGCYEYYKVD
ncbi:MAG: hypothetical protein J6V35_08300 [Bacteroidales bacterium]|nr:hypothetical protein [Bacteroidales bacterium]